jgi:hypothetical protein
VKKLRFKISTPSYPSYPVSLGSMTWLDLMRTDHKCEANKTKVDVSSIYQVRKSAVSGLWQQEDKKTSEEKLSIMAKSQNFPPKLRCSACLPNRIELFRAVSNLNLNCEESGQFGAIKPNSTTILNCSIGCVSLAQQCNIHVNHRVSPRRCSRNLTSLFNYFIDDR